MKFSGHERDLQSTTTNTLDDLDYMHARFHSPLTGRMLSVDPAGGDASRPQSWNRYAYVMGNPMNFTDPSGLYPNPAGLRGAALRQRCYAAGDCVDETITIVDTAPTLNLFTALEKGLDSVADSGFVRNFAGGDSGAVQSLRVASSFIGNLGAEPPSQCMTLGSTTTCGHPLVLGAMPGPPVRSAANLSQRAADLIRGQLKRSKSYHSELAGKTYQEILELAKGQGSDAKAARQMKKLIEAADRLSEKVGGK